MYKWVHIAHSKGGRCETMQVQIRDMVYTLMPISNTITAVVMWITLPPYAEDTAALNKFFNIKTTNNETIQTRQD